jgi:hypothetical protein
MRRCHPLFLRGALLPMPRLSLSRGVAGGGSRMAVCGAVDRGAGEVAAGKAAAPIESQKRLSRQLRDKTEIALLRFSGRGGPFAAAAEMPLSRGIK